jgi:signal transduction histidine kinase
MPIIFFFYGLSFGGLGLAALLQFRRGGALPLRKQLPWLAAFGLAYAGVGWLDMFLQSSMSPDILSTLKVMRTILQPLSGLLLLRFGWGMLTQLTPLPRWTRIIPGIVIVPLAFVLTYAATTFVTPSPIDIPIDIWSRYLLYLPGSIMAGVGFIRQRNENRRKGLSDVSRLMLGAGVAFLAEAVVVGLIVPAAPYGPVSYYNYDRVQFDTVPVEQVANTMPFTMIPWLDYDSVLETTGLPVQFWRMISSIAVLFFVVRGLDVFDAMERRQMQTLQAERDRAQSMARDVAERWTEALVSISRRIAELDDLDNILLDIVSNARQLLDSDYVAIGLVNDHHQLMLRCYAASDSAIIPPQIGLRIQVDVDLLSRTLQTGIPYCTDGSEPREAIEGLCFGINATAHEAAIFPLLLDNYAVGVLWSARFEPKPYSPTDLIGLEQLADQAVIAIQHGLMAAQLQSLAVVDERARIAREMHDGLAQILGYMNLQVQTLEALLKQNKRDHLFNELQQMREAVQTAHADVRENILSLRTTLSTDAGVASAIEEYLDGFSVQTGIDVRFENHVGERLGLTPLAEVQLVCILQEALANVRKHASADTVCVTLGQNNGCAYLEIADNGVGIQQPVAKYRFGLHTMRERAESVGGQIMIESAPGQGTKITCQLPEVDNNRDGKVTIPLAHVQEAIDAQ